MYPILTLVGLLLLAWSAAVWASFADLSHRVGGGAMNSLQSSLQWIEQNSFIAVSILFGGSVLFVTLYTFFHDYRRLTERQ
jgi:hypothetical protein